MLAALSRFYRLPAHEIMKWNPEELATNWLVCAHALRQFKSQLSGDTLVFPTVNLSPL